MTAPIGGKGPYSWLNKTGNSWRTSNDIDYSFASILSNLDSQENIPRVHELAGRGSWNDPDMLMFGNAKAKLTSVEAASHLGLWAVLKAPLLLSTDVDALTELEMSMLTNGRMIAIHQDALGKQAERILPVADFRVGGTVHGAPSVPGYSLPLNQNWVKQTLAGHPASVFQMRNLAANLCLGRQGSAGTVSLLACDARDSRTHWNIRNQTVTWQLSAPSQPSFCLGLRPVANTSEYEQAVMVDCNNSKSRWEYGSKYLNMTFGSLCTEGLSLDAAPRSPHNIFVGPLQAGNFVILMLNRGNVKSTISVDLTSTLYVPNKTKWQVTEVWSGKSLGIVTGVLTSTELTKHESMFVTLTKI